MKAWGLALVALLTAAAAAGAKPVTFHQVAKVTDWGATDGVGLAAFPTTKHDLVLVSHARGPITSRRLPVAVCNDGERPWDYLAGGGELVAQCPYELVIQNLRTGKFGDPPYLREPGGFFDAVGDGSEGDEVHANAIGSHWIGATVAQYTGYPTRYLDWHSGKSADDPSSATQFADVNSATLVRQLCSPLERTPIPPMLGDGFYPYFYNGSFGVTVAPAAQGQVVTLQRCGSRRGSSGRAPGSA